METILEKLNREITEQTRNGRTDIFISTYDLEKLGMSKFENQGRVYIPLDKLNKLIELYKEKQIKEKEDSWESITK